MPSHPSFATGGAAESGEQPPECLPATLDEALVEIQHQRVAVATLRASLASAHRAHVEGMAALEAEEEAISNKLTHRLARARESASMLARESEVESDVRHKVARVNQSLARSVGV